MVIFKKIKKKNDGSWHAAVSTIDDVFFVAGGPEMMFSGFCEARL